MQDKITSYTISQQVTGQMTAAAAGSGSLEVFATPIMAALMENAAAHIAQQYVDDGCTTVGTILNIKHMAASPIGAEIKVTAELSEIDGRRFVFKVEAFDNAGKIGEGIHERFSVKSQSFLDKAAKRCGK